MRDLFTNRTELEPLQLEGAEILYMSEFNMGVAPTALINELIADTPWRQENVRVWGRIFNQPRLVAWYGDAGRSYSYSGIALTPMPWTNRLKDLKRRVEDTVHVDFNSVLLNYYRNGNDSMGLHSDDERELGKCPIIASISIGVERPFVFKHKSDNAAKTLKVLLESGSLLLMQGDTQKNYKHGIMKDKSVVGPRINLTFRRIGLSN